MKAYSIKIQYPEDLQKMEIVLSMERSNEVIKKISKLKEITEKDKLLKVDIKQDRNKRSLDANAYCWIISQKIARKIGNTKEFVYRAAIRQVGDFQILPIKNEAFEKWKQIWENNGLGWQCQNIGKSKLEGYTNTINYFGSSTYDSKQMSLLLEELVFQAKELNIDTMTPEEQEILINKWEEKH